MDENVKKLIEQHVVERMISALDRDEIKDTDVPDIADFVLKGVDSITSEEEKMAFLRELASKWRIFTGLLVTQSGEVREKVEDEVAGGVLALAQHGKIEEVLNISAIPNQNIPSMPNHYPEVN